MHLPPRDRASLSGAGRILPSSSQIYGHLFIVITSIILIRFQLSFFQNEHLEECKRWRPSSLLHLNPFRNGSQKRRTWYFCLWRKKDKNLFFTLCAIFCHFLCHLIPFFRFFLPSQKKCCSRDYLVNSPYSNPMENVQSLMIDLQWRKQATPKKS